MGWTTSGNHEPVKAGAHGIMLGLALVFVCYNTLAWWRRRDRHLAVNAAAYLGLVGLEVYQVGRHLQHARGP